METTHPRDRKIMELSRNVESARMLKGSETLTMLLCRYFIPGKNFHYEENLCNIQDFLKGSGTFFPVGKLIKTQEASNSKASRSL